MAYRSFVLCSIFIAGVALGQSPVNTAIEIKLDRGALVGSYTLAPRGVLGPANYQREQFSCT